MEEDVELAVHSHRERRGRRWWWAAVAVLCAAAAGGGFVAVGHRVSPAASVAHADEPSSTASGALHVGYVPEGFVLVGSRTSEEPSARFAHVSNLFMYDHPASTGGGQHGAYRQFNLNVMTGHNAQAEFETNSDAQLGTRTTVRGHDAFVTLGHPNPDTGAADNTLTWAESESELVFLSTRGLDRDELFRIAEGLVRG